MDRVGPVGDYKQSDGVADSDSAAMPRPPLRKPLPNSKAIFAKTDGPAMSHSLNASAAEFVPMVRQVGGDAPPPAPPPVETSLNVNCEEFVPMSQQIQPDYVDYMNHVIDTNFYYDDQIYVDPSVYADFQRLTLDRPAHLEVTSEEVNLSTVDLFKEVLFRVTMRPSMVDDMVYLANYLRDFSSHIDNEKTLENIIILLIEQGTQEANFRYSGARICGHLITLGQELTDLPVSNFRRKLMSCLQHEFQNPNHDVNRKSSFLMFVAELFLHLKTSDNTPYMILRTAIFDSMIVLLEHPTDDSIKCVCQILKLTGALIDDTDCLRKADCKANYELVYQRLALVGSQCCLNRTSHALLESVMSQHRNNWGRKSSSSSLGDAGGPVPDNGNEYQNEPVFYSVNSEMISRHEAGFDIDYDLSGPGIDNSPYLGQIGPTYYYSGMDPEIEAAYEDFLKQQDSTNRPR